MKSAVFKIGIVIVIALMVSVSYFYFIQHQKTKEAAAASGKKTEVHSVKESETNKHTEKPAVIVENSNENQNINNPSGEVKVSGNQQPVIAKPAPATENQNRVQKEFLVVIDPGHQQNANLGQEPVGPGASETKMKVTGGATGVVTGKAEYQLALDASFILGDLLKKRGIHVIYTRTTNNVNLTNKDRANIANQYHADLFVRIHADSSDNKNVRGLSVLTPGTDDPYTKAIYQESLMASQLILEETRKNPAVKVNGISYRDDLAGFNWSKVPSTLVEMGFMSNPTEDKDLSDPAYLSKLMINLADGIMDYLRQK